MPAEQDDAARVAAIRARVEASDEGPWYPFVSPWPDKMHAVTQYDHAGVPVAYVGVERMRNDANLAFIAASREDVPWLLERLARAERERDEARAALARSGRWIEDHLAGIKGLAKVLNVTTAYGDELPGRYAARIVEGEAILTAIASALQDAPAPPVGEEHPDAT